LDRPSVFLLSPLTPSQRSFSFADAPSFRSPGVPPKKVAASWYCIPHSLFPQPNAVFLLFSVPAKSTSNLTGTSCAPPVWFGSMISSWVGPLCIPIPLLTGGLLYELSPSLFFFPPIVPLRPVIYPIFPHPAPSDVDNFFLFSARSLAYQED